MDATQPRIVICPVCESSGTMLHHDLRALLVYSCQKCLHEWQIDPADEPPQADQATGTATGLHVITSAAEATRPAQKEAPRSTDPPPTARRAP
jgi:hypothetical protein